MYMRSMVLLLCTGFRAVGALHVSASGRAVAVRRVVTIGRATTAGPRASAAESSKLLFGPLDPAAVPSKTIVVGRREALLTAPLPLPEGLPPSVWSRLVSNAAPGDNGAEVATSFLTGDDSSSGSGADLGQDLGI